MPVLNPHYTYNPLKTTAYCTWAKPLVAILENGRQTQVYHRTSGRQADSGRWAPGLSSAHCLPSPPHVCSRVYSQLMVYKWRAHDWNDDLWLVDDCRRFHVLICEVIAYSIANLSHIFSHVYFLHQKVSFHWHGTKTGTGKWSQCMAPVSRACHGP